MSGRHLVAAVALPAVVVLASCSAGGDATSGSSATAPRVERPRAGEGVETAAVYLDVVGGAGDRLTGASSPAAASVSLHTVDPASGAMAAADELELDGGVTRLEPGGSHLMLEGLHQPLVPGSTVVVELRFADSTPVTVSAPVLAYADLLEALAAEPASVSPSEPTAAAPALAGVGG